MATRGVQSPATSSRGHQARLPPPAHIRLDASDFVLNGRSVPPPAGACGARLTGGRLGWGPIGRKQNAGSGRSLRR